LRACHPARALSVRERNQVKLFHISDVLTATTGRLVSSRHMAGAYDIYNFLTGDNLFTHQLPRVARESQPWLKAQFPRLVEGAPEMDLALAGLDRQIENWTGDRSQLIAAWVEGVRVTFGLPEQIPVYELGADMHTHIDPLEEARAMCGDDKVLVVDPTSEQGPARPPDGGRASNS
jgi:hypothetical protein